MKRLLPPLFVLLSILTLAAADDFHERLGELQADGDRAAFERFLDKARSGEKDNPDFYATAGNYWWQLSRSLGARAEPAVGSDPTLSDSGGRDLVAGEAQVIVATKAYEILSEGARRFPRRVDIVLGLAHVQNESGKLAESVATLTALLAIAKDDPGSLRWKMGAPLPAKPEVFLPESLQGFSSDLYGTGTDESKALCGTLCSAIIATFPSQPYAYNIKAALAASAGDYDAAARLLETASKKAPDDGLVLLNLAKAHAKTGARSKAVAAYQRLLTLDVDAGLKRQAQAALEKLDR